MTLRCGFVTTTPFGVAQEGYYMASDTLIALAMMIWSGINILAIMGFIVLLIRMD
jgi:hypothetical protein